jgi:hypothetical protein
MSDLPKVPRDKYRENQNVPIVAERLVAAIEFQGLSVKRTAELADEKQQTIQRIAQGTTQRCRHARRRRLAATLGVADEWLGGADVPPIAGLPAGTAWTIDGVDTRLADENFSMFSIGDAALPPAYQLQWVRLSERVLEAWRRDIAAGIEDAQTLAELFPGQDADAGDPTLTVSRLLQRALGAMWWRRRLLLPIRVPEAPANVDQLGPEERWELALENERLVGAQAPGVSPADMDEFARRAAEAIHVILGPWIEGRRALNYQAAFILLQWLRGGMLLDVPPGLPER